MHLPTEDVRDSSLSMNEVLDLVQDLKFLEKDIKAKFESIYSECDKIMFDGYTDKFYINEKLDSISSVFQFIKLR